jgi:GTP-binding protein
LLPVVAIVGRPNVGKSTLFNALTRTRDALVADMPGVTRDRQYGISRVGKAPCLLVDTGGLVSNAEGIDYLTAKQVHQAIDEAHLVLFVVSARDGLMAEDEEIASLLRKSSRKVILVANKVDGLDEDTAMADFASLGMGELLAVAAAHRRGLDTMMRRVERLLPEILSANPRWSTACWVKKECSRSISPVPLGIRSVPCWNVTASHTN